MSSWPVRWIAIPRQWVRQPSTTTTSESSFVIP